MTTALFSHPDCLKHVNLPGHPEQVARLEYIHRTLDGDEFNNLLRKPAEPCADADILRCHTPSHLKKIQGAIPIEGHASLDGDTNVSSGSLRAAMRAVGANLAAIDTVISGEADNAFVACRPPGHHAETETAMGFCLFGSIAIGAKYALDHHKISRVAIIDFDVHHGNGTQDLLWDEPRSLFCSTHQMPLYPGTGAPHETGAHGNVLNIPLAPQTGSAEMKAAYENTIFPAVESFNPDLILVSAGFDSHIADPLGGLNWSTDDFAWITGRICDLADKHCGGRLVSTLEGGYDLDALAESVAAHVKTLMERGK